MSTVQSTITVLFTDAGFGPVGDVLLHLPGAYPGTLYTACGLDAGAMARAERPSSWAGMWCGECFKNAGAAR